MEDFEIVDLLSLHRQMTMVIFRDPDTQKCEVQILPVSLKMIGNQNTQAMLKIPSEPEDEAAAISVEVDEALNREIMDWCEVIRSKIDREELPFVTREELEQNVDAVLARIENGESPILIRNAGNPDLLLFGWEDYLSRFPTLHTPEEIAEIEAACFEMKEMEAE